METTVERIVIMPATVGRWRKNHQPSQSFGFLSRHSLSHTGLSEFDNDDHAIVFADGILRAAEPQVTSVEAWRETNLLYQRERAAEGKGDAAMTNGDRSAQDGAVAGDAIDPS